MKIRNLNIRSKFASLLMVPFLMITGCGKSDCDMKEYHLHKYEKDGFVRYIDDEHLENDGYNWTDEVVYVRESDRDLYKFEKKKDLFKIDDNIDTLISTTSVMDDYIEYEYSYRVPHHVRVGKVTTTYYTTSYDWTTDTEQSSLTGKIRLCRYTYTGYKVVLNDKGKYELVEGITSDDINDVINDSGEYPYMMIDFYGSRVLCEGVIDEAGNPYFEDDSITYKKEK